MRQILSAENKKFEIPISAKLFYVLMFGFTEQNFLGQPLIPLCLSVVPKRYKRNLALTFLGMSPHYFIYQWSNKYPSAMSHKDRLEAEHQRMLASRKKICEQILLPYLNPQMTVLDFGCGPGYLAQEVSKYVKKVLAVDISCGVIACAKELCNSENIFYYTNEGRSLSSLFSNINLVYTFATVQHLSEELFELVLREIFRILKPQGKVLCHVALIDACHNGLAYAKTTIFKRFQKRFALRMISRTLDDVKLRIKRSGFNDPVIMPLKQICDIEDDIGRQHIFIFSKP